MEDRKDLPECECKCECECSCPAPKRKKSKPSIEERIYNILNTAEIIAVKLAQINQIIKKAKKKRKKKNQKLGKIDKKTGTLILKKNTRIQKATAQKRYKAPKKK